ncbi:LysR family transcriptional regulator substrate-binding protein [Streptomyces sp. NPDC054804]
MRPRPGRRCRRRRTFPCSRGRCCSPEGLADCAVACSLPAFRFLLGSGSASGGPAGPVPFSCGIRASASRRPGPGPVERFGRYGFERTRCQTAAPGPRCRSVPRPGTRGPDTRGPGAARPGARGPGARGSGAPRPDTRGPHTRGPDTGPFCDRHPHARVAMESLSSVDIRRGLAEFELDAAMTYLDDDELRQVRRFPLYEERYVLLTPVGGPLGDTATATWSQAAALPLCLLGPRMRNRRIIDECFAADGAAPVPAVESDSVAGLYAHLPGGRWSSVISHAWLHMFGVPAGMRVVPLEGPAHGPRVGLVIARSEPQSVLAEALVKVARQARLRDALDSLLTAHLDGPD